MGAGHCSKFVVVFRSKRGESSINSSTKQGRKPLRTIVESTIFKTHQNSPLFYESAALTAELRALCICSILHQKGLVGTLCL